MKNYLKEEVEIFGGEGESIEMSLGLTLNIQTWWARSGNFIIGYQMLL